jgi:hypothetical protein
MSPLLWSSPGRASNSSTRSDVADAAPVVVVAAPAHEQLDVARCRRERDALPAVVAPVVRSALPYSLVSLVRRPRRRGSASRPRPGSTANTGARSCSPSSRTPPGARRRRRSLRRHREPPPRCASASVQQSAYSVSARAVLPALNRSTRVCVRQTVGQPRALADVVEPAGRRRSGGPSRCSTRWCTLSTASGTGRSA